MVRRSRSIPLPEPASLTTPSFSTNKSVKLANSRLAVRSWRLDFSIGGRPMVLREIGGRGILERNAIETKSGRVEL